LSAKIDQGLTATATFRLLYVFVVIEHRSRRLIHCNVTAHPTAAWTLQQLREAVGLEERYEYLIHDRDSIFAKHLDESIGRLGLKVLKSPPRSPRANAICERRRKVPSGLSWRRWCSWSKERAWPDDQAAHG
jgi:putative transposase